MANTKGTRIDLNNLTTRDKDIMNLPMDKVIKKHKLAKGSIYSRRNSINKRLEAAGTSWEELLSKQGEEQPAEAPEVKKPRGRRPAQPVEEAQQEPEPKPKREKAPAPVEEEQPIRDLAVIKKNVPVVMKPIEITFDNFSIKLNGVPKRIAVNPDTNAIEIDL